ncbi:MAG TPA: nitroreductase, partial [Deltaproteobacteria bacterium]|nr:nitroreductase [Deltaproteobacteria bacterium]
MDKDLERFYELYKRRKSVRRFLKKEVEEDKLNRLLDILRRAQSAANCQPWHFVVVKGEDKERLNPVFTTSGFQDAPLCIVACAEPSKAWVRKADGRN